MTPPALTLPAGSRYFEADGRRAPVMLRNVSAGSATAFTPLFHDAHAAGTAVARLQLTQGLGYDTLGIDSAGNVLPAFAAAWDAVIDSAADEGMDVVIVFAIWGDWNDGTPALGWTHFAANPLSQALGGPAATPADLFADTETQHRWLGWLQALVTRWKDRTNIVAWETFSELDIATGATEMSATAFAAKAGDVIRAADPRGRPVFASTSDLPLIQQQPWTTFWASPANDLVSLHTYEQDLDLAVITRVHDVMALTSKPIFLGESGLEAAEPNGTTLASAPAAPIGLESAIWAEVVSGSATARALYWEDGYAAFYPATGLALVNARNNLERRAADWIADKDFAGLAPLNAYGLPPLVATAMGSGDHVLGWARNRDFAGPTWDAAPLDQAQVEVMLPDGAADGAWTVHLTPTDDGATPTGDVAGALAGGILSFQVPGPFNRVAFEAARN